MGLVKQTQISLIRVLLSSERQLKKFDCIFIVLKGYREFEESEIVEKKVHLCSRVFCDSPNTVQHAHMWRFVLLLIAILSGKFVVVSCVKQV
jgi:hypothetical protein